MKTSILAILALLTLCAPAQAVEHLTLREAIARNAKRTESRVSWLYLNAAEQARIRVTARRWRGYMRHEMSRKAGR